MAYSVNGSSIENLCSDTQPLREAEIIHSISFNNEQQIRQNLPQRKVHSLSSLRYVPEDYLDGKDNSAYDGRSASMESLDDTFENTESLENIDSDPDLKLLEVEPDRWVMTVGKDIRNQLTEKQIKKQEHIYELIITEKNHCLLLKVMKEIFAKGMISELGMKESSVKTIFPSLDELITIHSSFLWTLRECQKANRFIPRIGELLLQQFTGYSSKGLKLAYGTFCATHQEAVSYYKELLRTDKRFQVFVRNNAGHRLMKKKGIQEGILFIAHRVTKYPLMLEALIKYSFDDPQEVELLRKALDNVKEILVNINSQVAERYQRRRLVEIYDKIDNKSSVLLNNGSNKFKRSALLSEGRKLMFEGQAACSYQIGKYQNIMVVLMSDILFFLQEHNQKFHFITPDPKHGVFSLERISLREKDDCDTRSLCIVVDNQHDVLTFDCVLPKDRKIWLKAFREAVSFYKNDTRMGFGKVKLEDIDVEQVKSIKEKIRVQRSDVTFACDNLEKSITQLCKILNYDEYISVPNFKPIEVPCSLRKNDPSYEFEHNCRAGSTCCNWGRGIDSCVQTIVDAIDSNISHRHRLEQLRRTQTRVMNERLAFTKEKEEQDRKINKEKEEIKRQQELIKARQEDINQQREDLYLKLEALRQQGIVLSPSLTIISSTPPTPNNPPSVHRASTFASTLPRTGAYGSSSTSVDGGTQEKPKSEIKHRHSTANLSMLRDSRSTGNLSSMSSSRRKSGPPVKQQLPMKLASLGSSGS